MKLSWRENAYSCPLLSKYEVSITIL